MAKSDRNATLLTKLTQKNRVLPADPEEMNENRSVAALRAVRGFSKDFGENLDRFDGEEQVPMVQQNTEDLLADVAHLGDTTPEWIAHQARRDRTGRSLVHYSG